MRQKDPKATHFNQKEETGTNPDLEELTNSKDYYIHKRKSDKLRLQATIQSIKYSNDFITDLEHKHSNLQTKQENNQHSPMKENQIQNLKDLKKSSEQCDVQT